MKKFRGSKFGLLAIFLFCVIAVISGPLVVYGPYFAFLVGVDLLGLSSFFQPLRDADPVFFIQILPIILCILFLGISIPLVYQTGAWLERLNEQKKRLALVIIGLLIVGLTVEFLGTMRRWNRGSSMTEGNQCSWIKHTPNGWLCEDNWDARYRSVQTTHNTQKLTMEATRGELTPMPALCFPMSLPANPSQSGITVPLLCVGNTGIYFQSTWEQDAWNFRFIGKNVSRKLYLDNLYSIGYMR